MIHRITTTLLLSLCLLIPQTVHAQNQQPPSQRFGVCSHIRHWENVLKIDYVQTIKDGGLISFRDGQEWDTIEKESPHP